jgi:hypothetical protein
MAGTGELVVCEGDGHLLARSADVIIGHLDAWLARVLGIAAEV